MRILVIGGSGMLGTDLQHEARRRGHDVDAPSSAELDITDPTSVGALAARFGAYDWCLNCAAYTAVDKAETDIRLATEINTFGPGYLSSACGMAGIKLIHVSTDFVFDGAAEEPYREEAPTNPLSVYGRTKRDGELAVREANPNASILRTSWLYGVNGSCFPRTIIRAWQAGKSLKVINDQYGCPTFTVDLARVFVDLVETNAYPDVYHACGTTVTSWHNFAVMAIKAWTDLKGIDGPIEIAAIPTEEYPTPATRPRYSVLSTEKIEQLGIAPMRPLEQALAEFVLSLDIPNAD